MFTGFFHNYSYQFVAKEFKWRANYPVTCFEMYITGYLIGIDMSILQEKFNKKAG